MALVVLLRGLNVGGHRSFRPTKLAEQLRHLGAVNIGAAGTFVIRKPIARERLRREVARRLPFDAEVVICEGREIVALGSGDFFAGQPARPDIVRFVSVLSRRPRLTPRLPMQLPPRGKWLVKVLARDGRFVVGLYRRHMKVIGHLGGLDRLFGVPVTTRNWNTLAAIAKALEPLFKKPALLAGGNPQIAKAEGDAPVQAYIAAMPGWKRDLGRRLDALIVRAVPGVRKSVKWNSPFYGVEGRGWFLSLHCFAKYVKVAFFRGTSLSPVPPGASKHKEVRYVDIREGELDEKQMAAWVRQAASVPGWDGS